MLVFFFFNDTATTEIYTLSLHDALPICGGSVRARSLSPSPALRPAPRHRGRACRRAESSSECTPDRKSTRLNSSHANISYAVFCLKKKTNHVMVSIESTTHDANACYTFR